MKQSVTSRVFVVRGERACVIARVEVGRTRRRRGRRYLSCGPSGKRTTRECNRDGVPSSVRDPDDHLYFFRSTREWGNKRAPRKASQDRFLVRPGESALERVELMRPEKSARGRSSMFRGRGSCQEVPSNF